MEQVAAGGDLLLLQHTCLRPHYHTHSEGEGEGESTGGVAAGQGDTG